MSACLYVSIVCMYLCICVMIHNRNQLWPMPETEGPGNWVLDQVYGSNMLTFLSQDVLSQPILRCHMSFLSLSITTELIDREFVIANDPPTDIAHRAYMSTYMHIHLCVHIIYRPYICMYVHSNEECIVPVLWHTSKHKRDWKGNSCW